MNFSTVELIMLPFLPALMLVFVPLVIVRAFFYLPTWIKIKGWKELAVASNLKFINRVKTGYFSHIGISIFSLVAGSYENKKLYAFSLVPYYHRAGRTSYTWINGIFHETISANKLDLAINDNAYKQLVPKGMEFDGYTIPVGVSTSEFLVIFSGIIFLKHDLLIPFETAKELWSAGRRYYASRASSKQMYFTKDNSAEDIKLIYNNEEAFKYYESVLGGAVDSKMVKLFFDTYQDFIKQTGRTVPVDLDSLTGGFKLTKFFGV